MANRDKYEADNDFDESDDSRSGQDRSNYEDMLVLLPANDNAGEKKPKQHRFRRCPYTPENIARLLAVAGFDPEKIPVDKRLGALHVAWAFEKRLFDERDIARSIGRSRACVRVATRYLRDAAKPGTVVG